MQYELKVGENKKKLYCFYPDFHMIVDRVVRNKFS
jgi:hypothetical protein